ncbi:WD repeat-containing protein, partial [Reticulomyxa filosa]
LDPFDSPTSIDINKYDWHSEFTEMKKFVINNFNLGNKHVLFRNILYVFNGHTNWIWCVAFSPLQSNNTNSKKKKGIGVIGGNEYTICSGSYDNTIRMWDIETTKELLIFKGHNGAIKSIKYGTYESVISGGANTILSGLEDKSVCLWDVRSGQQIQIFNGHTHYVNTVEYSPFE